MAALTLATGQAIVSPGNTRVQMETALAGEALVTGDVIIGGASGYVKSGANPTFIEGVVIEGAGAGKGASFVPAGSNFVLTGYDLSGSTIGDPIYAVNGRLNDADPGSGTIMGRVTYHAVAGKAIRLL